MEAWVREVTRGLVEKSAGLVMGLGRLPREPRVAKMGSRFSAAAAAFRIWARASVNVSAELDSRPFDYFLQLSTSA